MMSEPRARERERETPYSALLTFDDICIDRVSHVGPLPFHFFTPLLLQDFLSSSSSSSLLTSLEKSIRRRRRRRVVLSLPPLLLPRAINLHQSSSYNPLLFLLLLSLEPGRQCDGASRVVKEEDE